MNKWIVPTVIAAIAFVLWLIVSPALASLRSAPALPQQAPVCESRVDQLDMRYLVVQLDVERHAAYDTVLVFRVVEERVERFVVVTAKNGCIVGIGA